MLRNIVLRRPPRLLGPCGRRAASSGGHDILEALGPLSAVGYVLLTRRRSSPHKKLSAQVSPDRGSCVSTEHHCEDATNPSKKERPGQEGALQVLI